MKYAEVNTQIYMSMHFLLLELCVDSLEKTTLNQPQIMEEKRVPAVGPALSASEAGMLTNSLHGQGCSTAQ